MMHHKALRKGTITTSCPLADISACSYGFAYDNYFVPQVFCIAGSEMQGSLVISPMIERAFSVINWLFSLFFAEGD